MAARGIIVDRDITRTANLELGYAERQQLIGLLETTFSSPAIRKRQVNLMLYRNLWLFCHRASEAAKRVIDLVLVSISFVVLLPLLVGLYIAARAKGGGIVYTPRLGQGGDLFNELSFCFGPIQAATSLDRKLFRKLPALVNVFRGEISFIGPRPFSRDEVNAEDRWAWKRFHVRPGLICLWWIRRRANIAYRSETEIDAEYVESHSVRGDVGIMLRSIPAAFYGEEAKDLDEKVSLLGIPVDNVTMEQATGEIVRRSLAPEPSQVCFVNADCVNISYRDLEYKSILQDCGMVLADGIGVKLAGRLLRHGIRQNVNGTDLLPLLCEQMQRGGIGVYLIGGKPGVVEDVAKWMQINYPALPIRGSHHGFFLEDELETVLEHIRQSKAKVLLVAFGAPKQEKWIRHHLARTGCKVGIGVGGLFDFYAGRVPRAPVWIREIGMEWFFRFCQEPGRMWRRYFAGNLLFMGRVLFSRLGRSKITTTDHPE